MYAFLQGYPAYGRVYKTAKEMAEGFYQGRDFSLSSKNAGPYLSIRDFVNKEPSIELFDGMMLTQDKPKLSIMIFRADMIWPPLDPATEPNSSY
jgi:hypothetical protein